MIVNWKRFSFLFLFVALLTGSLAKTGQAAWYSLLDEHFDKDPRNQAQAWPWNTPIQNPAIRWRYNPWDPYRRAEGAVRSRYCWGYQSAFFNTRVTQNEDFPGSLWCAYTNGSDVNNTRWPEDVNYMPNQNAWVWWEPFDARDYAAGGASFWIKIDLDHFSYDSLSVCVITDPNQLTQPNIRANGKFGAMRNGEGDFIGISSFNSATDWVYRSIRFDDLRTLNANGTVRDSVSVMDEAFVAVCWVWQSDSGEVAGKGAFIDDVVIAVEDGLFDLQVVSMEYGYDAGNDSVYWTDVTPTYLKPTYFRLNYIVNGLGQSPDFRVTCDVDSSIIFDATVSQAGSVDTVYSIVTQNPWIATANEHVIRWKFDADSSIHESFEDNNTFIAGVDVPWTPAPQLAILTPSADSTEAQINLHYPVEVAISDSNGGEGRFTLFLYMVSDTAGLRAHPNMFDTMEAVVFDFGARQGTFNYNPDYGSRPVGSLWYIAGVVNDGTFGNNTIAFSRGRLLLTPLGVDSETALKPMQYSLAEPYPNPFNGEVKLEYALPVGGNVRLTLFDLAGRQVALLESGMRDAGVHSVSWKPVGIGGGVYLAKLEANGASFMKKLVYTP